MFTQTIPLPGKQQIACTFDHRLLVVFSRQGLEVKCRTCKQVHCVSWQELETIRATLQSTAIARA